MFFREHLFRKLLGVGLWSVWQMSRGADRREEMIRRFSRRVRETISRTLAPPPTVLGFFVAKSHLCLYRLEPLGELRIVTQDPRHSALQGAQARLQRYKLVLGCMAIVDCLCAPRLR